MGRIHTIPLNIGDLLGGTMGWDARKFGAYVSLFIACYQAKDHLLTDDPQELARIARCSGKTWGKICEQVMDKFIKDPNGSQKWTHEKVLTVAQDISNRSSINSDNVLKRWEKQIPFVLQSNNERNTIQYPKTKIQDPSDILFVKRERDYGGRYDIRRHLTEQEIDGCRLLAAGRSLDGLFDLFNGMVADGKFSEPKRPEMAFPAWLNSYVKKRKE